MSDPNSSIIILAAMKQELAPLCRSLGVSPKRLTKGHVLRVKYKAKQIGLLVTGVGREQAHKNLRQHESLCGAAEQVFIIGCCGAVDSHLKVGDIFLPECVRTTADHVGVSHRPFDTAHLHSCTISVKSGGDLFTGDHLMHYEDKQRIHSQFPDVCAVDMEAYYIVKHLQQKGMQPCVIKAVSDTLQTDLPRERFLRENTGTVPWSTRLSNTLRKPREMLKLLMLEAGVRKAAHRNARFMMVLLEDRG